MKKLWRTLSSVLGTTRSSAASLGHNADDFAKFFQRRFAAFELRQHPQSRILIKSQLDHHATSTYGRQYCLVILKSLLELLITRRVNWIQAHPAPTWLVKECSGLVADFVARLFNKSLETGYFPERFKHAIIAPLLKKDHLDPDQLNNYRPVSNLSFLS
jgi:hypothetical protein